jgi:hypothetical protein
MREYGMPEEEFDLASASGQGFSRPGLLSNHSASCTCGCRDGAAKTSAFQKLRSLFTSRDEKADAKGAKLMEAFAGLMLQKGQDEIDAACEAYADALGSVNNYDDAAAALQTAFENRSPDELAHLIDEVRFAAQGIGKASAGGRHA